MTDIHVISKKLIEEFGLENCVVLKLTPRELEIIDQYIDDGKRNNTQAAATALFAVFIKMLMQDNMRVSFSGNGAAVVDVKGMDYD